MNVAFVGNYRDDQVNGVMNSGFHLATALVSLNVKVFFYYDGPIEMNFTDNHNIEHRVFKANNILRIIMPTSFKVHLRLNPDKIDVYHLHSVFIPYHYSIARILSKHRIPFVITPHGGYNRLSLERTLSTFRAAKKFYIQVIERFVINHANGMIAVTELEAGDLRTFGVSCPIRMIPNTVSTSSKITLAAKNKITLLYLGRYDIRFKGLFFLLETFKLISWIRKDVKLVMHGEGKNKKQLMRFVQEEQIANVEIGDPVFGMEKDNVLANCTAYFQPSRSEAFGMSMVEAMSFGKPVIVTEESYMTPLLRDNHTGLIVPYDPYIAANEILKYLNQPDTLKAHGIKCRALAQEEFNPTRIGRATIAFYQQIRSSSVDEPKAGPLENSNATQEHVLGHA